MKTLEQFLNEMQAAGQNQKLLEALRVMDEALVNFSDYENPNEPNRVCWPTNEYMKRSREARQKVQQLINEVLK